MQIVTLSNEKLLTDLLRSIQLEKQKIQKTQKTESWGQINLRYSTLTETNNSPR